MKDGSSTTVSVSRKVNLGNYESEDVFVSMTVTPEMTVADMEQLLAANEAAYELVKGEVERRVFAMKNPTIQKAEPKKFGPAPADAHTATVAKIVTQQGFTNAQCREFKAICDHRELDHITTFLAAWEDGCQSYDEFVLFASDGTRPSNAKPRLEVAK